MTRVLFQGAPAQTINANELKTKNACKCTNAMTGDFRLIDYIFDLFFGKPNRMP